MAARILPFRSLVPLEKAVGYTPVAGTVRMANGPRTPGAVVTMAKRAASTRGAAATAMRTKVEGEMAEGYVEVEITGMSLRRLACVYGVLLQTTWGTVMDGVRALLGSTPVA